MAIKNYIPQVSLLNEIIVRHYPGKKRSIT